MSDDALADLSAWTLLEVRWALAVRWWLAGSPIHYELPEGLRRVSLAFLGAHLGLEDGPGVSRRLWGLLAPEEVVALTLLREDREPVFEHIDATLRKPWGPEGQIAWGAMSPIHPIFRGRDGPRNLCIWDDGQDGTWTAEGPQVLPP